MPLVSVRAGHAKAPSIYQLGQQNSKSERRQTLTLSRNMNVDVQLIRPVPHKVRVLEEPTANQHGIYRAIAQIPLSLLPGSDAANRSHLDPCSLNSLFHGRSPGDLVARAGGDLLSAVKTAARDVEQIYTLARQDFAQLASLLDMPLWQGGVKVEVVRARHADQQRKVCRDDSASKLDNFDEKTGSVLKRAAVFICSLVGGRREKRVEKVAVSGVNLDGLQWSVLIDM